MENLPDHILKKIAHVSNEVQENLRKKGIAIPVDNEDGTISVGNYVISKTSDGFYNVLDYSGQPVVSMINLPQTAAIVANNLALGKFVDNTVVDNDRKYGYALFEENLTTKALEKSSKKGLDYFDLMLTKRMIARAKKNIHKHEVVKSFEKLRNLV